MREYIGIDVIADELGVSRAAVSNWRQRGIPGMPEHAAVVRHRELDQYVYLRSSLPAWKQWHAAWKMSNAQRQLERARTSMAKAQKRMSELEGEER